MKYKNNTISKEYRRLLKKITFNWSSYNGTDILKAKEYLIIYDGRWNIEIMFRTLKQSLGLSQCQSRNLEYQKAHIYSSFFSYGFIQHEKEAHSFENSEVAIKYLSALKLNMAVKGIHSFSRNFDHVA